MSHYAIGDVQGCYNELMQLLEIIDFNEHRDRLWFAGDVINGGPDNLAVLQFISHLPCVPVMVLGNHELHYLSVFYGVRSLQSGDTFQDVLQSSEAEFLTDWLCSCSLVHYEASFSCLMMHAGLDASWSLHDTLTYAGAIEEHLHSKDPSQIKTFLEMIFGYIQTPQAMDLKQKVDTFTRMRFCDVEGKMDLGYKGDIAHAPSGLYPWYEVDKKISPPLWKTMDVLFGHWAALEGKVSLPHLFALDTACVWGGKLSALRLEDKQWFRVAGKKYR